METVDISDAAVEVAVATFCCHQKLIATKLFCLAANGAFWYQHADDETNGDKDIGQVLRIAANAIACVSSTTLNCSETEKLNYHFVDSDFTIIPTTNLYNTTYCSVGTSAPKQFTLHRSHAFSSSRETSRVSPQHQICEVHIQLCNLSSVSPFILSRKSFRGRIEHK